MEKNNIQKELFEFTPPGKQHNRFGALFHKTDLVISLSAEKLVFVSIGILMLLVVSFALGVEKGKAVAVNIKPAESIPPAVQPSVQSLPANIPIKQAAQVKTAATSTNITPKEKVPVNPTQSQNQADKDKPYTIVAAAFSKEATAANEVIRLKGSGFEAFVYHSEPYYLACIGSFSNKDGAKTILKKVKQMRRDAYIRLR